MAGDWKVRPTPNFAEKTQRCTAVFVKEKGAESSYNFAEKGSLTQRKDRYTENQTFIWIYKGQGKTLIGVRPRCKFAQGKE
jgi:hypothetical protein